MAVPNPPQKFTPRSDCKECSVTMLLPASTMGTCKDCGAPRRKPRAPRSPGLLPVHHSYTPPMSPVGSPLTLCPMFGSAERGSMPPPLSYPGLAPVKPICKPSHTIQHARLPAAVVFVLAGWLMPMLPVPHALQQERQQAPLRPALPLGSSPQRTLTLGSSTATRATAAARSSRADSVRAGSAAAARQAGNGRLKT